MATDFTEIYELNSVIKNDSRLLGKPTNLVYEIFNKYLTFSISYFADDCYKDLNNYTPFNQIEYEFIGDGINNQFILDTAPPSDTNFYIAVNEVSNGYTYSYDNTNLKVTINPIPPLNSNVDIASYVIGSFPIDLNIKEKIILAEGMNIPYLEEKKNRETLLNQSVYGSDFKQFSQAQHIHELNATLEQSRMNLRSMINEYTYKQNINKLMGLGGGILNNGGDDLPL